MKVAFDVDGTLIVPDEKLGMDVPNYEVIDMYRWFQKSGNYMIVWSGSGNDYAQRWAEKLGLHPNEIRTKEKSLDVDIAFDDQVVDLATANIRVGNMETISIPTVWIPEQFPFDIETHSDSNTNDDIEYVVYNKEGEE